MYISNEELINRFYKNYIKNESEWKELRKKMIFARAHLCSSSLLQWGNTNRKDLLNKEKADKIWKLLTDHSDSIDSYYVKNFGAGSMNGVAGKENVTEKNLEDLLELIKKTEKFIKEELEKGTKYEGEFEKEFPDSINIEEEAWEYHKRHKEMMKKKDKN